MEDVRRKYDPVFKAVAAVAAVQVVVETGRPIAEIARAMNINPGTLGNWVNEERKKRGGSDAGLNESERDELKRLRKENVELRMQRDVLKRSVVLWVDEAMGRRS